MFGRTYNVAALALKNLLALYSINKDNIVISWYELAIIIFFLITWYYYSKMMCPYLFHIKLNNTVTNIYSTYIQYTNTHTHVCQTNTIIYI